MAFSLHLLAACLNLPDTPARRMYLAWIRSSDQGYSFGNAQLVRGKFSVVDDCILLIQITTYHNIIASQIFQ